MEITVNGQLVCAGEGCSIADVLVQTNKRGLAVAVELNGDVVPREMHVARKLHAGDSLEVVTLVGGG